MNDTHKTTLLKIDHATVRRDGRHIVDDISLEIADGAHTAIVGANGSGKTTLIKLITRDHYPLARPDDEPIVTIFGKDRWDVFELRAMMGIVSSDIDSDFVATGYITGMEAALSGFFSSHGVPAHQTITDTMREKAKTAMTLVEASHLAVKPMNEMSTGEVRRVLIARALVHDPRALLLDEPTTGLDIVARRRFLGTVRSLAHRGKTIILVTHHVEEILPEITNIILMRDGKIAANGLKEDLLTSANLSATFDAPVTVSQNGGYYSADLRGK